MDVFDVMELLVGIHVNPSMYTFFSRKMIIERNNKGTRNILEEVNWGGAVWFILFLCMKSCFLQCPHASMVFQKKINNNNEF